MSIHPGEIVRVRRGKTFWLVQSVSDESAVLYSGRSTRTAPVADLVAVPAKAEPVLPQTPDQLASSLGLRLFRVHGLVEQALHLPEQQIVLVSDDVSDHRVREAIYSASKSRADAEDEL